MDGLPRDLPTGLLGVGLYVLLLLLLLLFSMAGEVCGRRLCRLIVDTVESGKLGKPFGNIVRR